MFKPTDAERPNYVREEAPSKKQEDCLDDPIKWLEHSFSNLSECQEKQKLAYTPQEDFKGNNGKSLAKLTEHFIYMLQTAADGLVDLNLVIVKLDSMQKRRIYDIVSVLEGIGLVEKNSKNVVLWKGDMMFNPTDEIRLEQLREEVTQLKKQEERLDDHIKWLEQSFSNVSEYQENHKLAYTSQEDLRELYPKCFNIAIQVPTSASIEMNTIGKASRLSQMTHELIINSKSVLPKVYVLSDETNNEEKK